MVEFALYLYFATTGEPVLDPAFPVNPYFTLLGCSRAAEDFHVAYPTVAGRCERLPSRP